MQHLTTMELLSARQLGNVRRRPSGSTVPLDADAAARVKALGRRAMMPGVLFDSSQPTFNLASWTVWSNSAPESTTGRVGPNEFRALVRFLPCVALH